MCGNRVLRGKYELRKKLGEGGSGVVYLAWDRHLERMVAVKEEQSLQNMEADKTEMEMLKTLKHPMLPAVYDYFEEESRYLVMEYIKGISLHNYIEQEGSVPEEQACIWALQLLELLTYLHTRKPPVIYRDLKPENIIVCPEGNLRVVDFGAALSMRYDTYRQKNLAGTRGYAAPEMLDENRISGMAANEQSDIYTLGATLYHMLTGYHPAHPPYGIRPVRSIKPQLSRQVEKIVEKCTQSIPSRRYQTAEEVKKDLSEKMRMDRRYAGRRHLYESKKEKRSCVVKKIEKRIWLTEKKTIGLFSVIVLTVIVSTGAFSFRVRGKETPLPVTAYNTQGQKLVIRYGSVYKAEGNLILELEEELFGKENIQQLSIKLTDNVTGESRERIFYIQ
ncbi:MAG: serine/threonine protein kinase [Bacillus sp. (in: Bacteria)]|nr:serine/threonine protein kinase [Bacillus sp. (in: firmicutes)]MCM1425946.1 serine/threonine protein kinase [Eubacterium sp.]